MRDSESVSSSLMALFYVDREVERFLLGVAGITAAHREFELAGEGLLARLVGGVGDLEVERRLGDRGGRQLVLVDSDAGRRHPPGRGRILLVHVETRSRCDV